MSRNKPARQIGSATHGGGSRNTRGSGFESTRSNERNIFQMGIGRALSDNSARDFRRQFASVMPPWFKLIARRRPGVMYVSGEDLTELPRYTHLTAPNGRKVRGSIEGLARTLVGNFLHTGSASRSVEVPFQELMVRESTPTNYRIIMRLGDTASKMYPQEFLLQGERTRANAKLLDKDIYQPDSVDVLRHAITVGYISLPEAESLHDPLRELEGRLVGDEVKLDPVGVLDIDYPRQ